MRFIPLVRPLLAVVLGLSALGPGAVLRAAQADAPADLVLLNGNIATVDASSSMQQAVAIRDGKFVAVGSNEAVSPFIGEATQVVDLNGRTVLPGLVDSRIHALRGGGTWDSELHWESVTSLAEGLDM